jgi:hypothetical protein
MKTGKHKFAGRVAEQQWGTGNVRRSKVPSDTKNGRLALSGVPLFSFTPAGKRAPGVSKEDLADGVKRAKEEHLRVFGTRYEDDTINPKDRFEGIKAAFGKDCFCDHTIHGADYLHEPKWGLNAKAHATLTLCYKKQSRRLPVATPVSGSREISEGATGSAGDVVAIDILL